MISAYQTQVGLDGQGLMGRGGGGDVTVFPPTLLVLVMVMVTVMVCPSVL